MLMQACMNPLMTDLHRSTWLFLSGKEMPVLFWASHC